MNIECLFNNDHYTDWKKSEPKTILFYGCIIMKNIELEPMDGPEPEPGDIPADGSMNLPTHGPMDRPDLESMGVPTDESTNSF